MFGFSKYRNFEHTHKESKYEAPSLVKIGQVHTSIFVNLIYQPGHIILHFWLYSLKSYCTLNRTIKWLLFYFHTAVRGGAIQCFQ